MNDTDDAGNFSASPAADAADYMPWFLIILGYFVQAMYGIVFVVGLMGNTLVIYVVLRYTKMQTVTNLYILNLAVADEFFLIGIPFLMVTSGLGFWPFGTIMCKIYMTTTSVNQFTSSLLLTVMSADRFIAVCHPISSTSYRTPAIAKMVSFMSWVASFLMIVPIVMYAGPPRPKEEWAPINATLSSVDLTTPWTNRTFTMTSTSPTEPPPLPSDAKVSCNINWPKHEYLDEHAAFTLYTFTLTFVIPLIFISVFYFLVLLKLRFQFKKVGSNNKSKEKRRSHRKVTRLVLTVITVYVLCWLPYWISQVSLIFTPPRADQSQYKVAVFLLVGCLGYSNSAINPILYAFLSDNFKKSFMKACTCANQREANKALAGENSVFTRRCKTSQRGGATQVGSRSPNLLNEASGAAAAMRTAVTEVDLSVADRPGSDQPLNNTVAANSTKRLVNNLTIAENNLKRNNEDIPLLERPKAEAPEATKNVDRLLLQSQL